LHLPWPPRGFSHRAAPMLHCPSCDTEYDEALAVCPDCDLEGETVRCPRCATEYVGRGCPACGALAERIPCDVHGDRAAAGRCVVCGRLVCDECEGAEQQRAFLCAEHRGVRVTDGWAEVYTTTSEVEAQLLRDDLRAQGIDAQVLSQRDMMFSVDLGELSIVRLLVPVWTYAEAVEAVKAHLEGQPEEMPCPSCGSAVEAAAVECPACGTAVA
jgi:hypothetical protein